MHAHIEFLKAFSIVLLINTLYFWLLIIWGLLISFINLSTLCCCNVHEHTQIEFINTSFNCTFYLLPLCSFNFFSFIRLCTLCSCNVHVHAQIEFIKTFFFLQIYFLFAKAFYFWLLIIWGHLISLISLCTLCSYNVHVHAHIEYLNFFSSSILFIY